MQTFQAAINRSMLDEEEKASKYFTVDMTELLRGDIRSRYEAYRIGLEANFLQIDEIRYKEDLPPLGMNYIKLGLQDVLYDPKTKEIYTPNTKELAKIGGEGLTTEADSGIIGDERAFKDEDHPRNKKTGKFVYNGGSKSPSPTGANVLEVQGFYSKAKLNNHWKDHEKQYIKDGITTKEQYLQRALELVQSPVGGSIKGHLTKEGHIVRYDEKTNDFVKANIKKGIITMFKPDEGKIYYENNRKGDLEHGGKG